MSTIHVLAGGNGTFSVVVHTPTPVGTNSAGVSWQTALVNSGMARTSLVEGNGPGQITTAEKVQVESGAVVEGRFSWGDIAGADNPTLIADLDLRAQQLISARLAQLADQLKYFGFVRP